MQRFALVLTKLVMTFVVFAEPLAEKAKWLCVELTPTCMSDVENGQ